MGIKGTGIVLTGRRIGDNEFGEKFELPKITRPDLKDGVEVLIKCKIYEDYLGDTPYIKTDIEWSNVVAIIKNLKEGK